LAAGFGKGFQLALGPEVCFLGNLIAEQVAILADPVTVGGWHRR